MRNPHEAYSVSQVEPGWQILIDHQWLVVGIVVESETPDGVRYITFVFEDSKVPAFKLRKTGVITARPPHQQPIGEPGS